jgi:HD superfamily phosphodiesterase
MEPQPIKNRRREHLDRIREEVKKIVGDEKSHGLLHALNTMELADRIGRVEGGDVLVIGAAALMHDIGRENIFHDPGHGRRGAARAREILDRLDVPTDRELVCDIIARHDDPIEREDQSIESAVVRDADRLELLRIGPDYLDLSRLITQEALRQVAHVLSLHYGSGGERRQDVAETIRRAHEMLDLRDKQQNR